MATPLESARWVAHREAIFFDALMAAPQWRRMHDAMPRGSLPSERLLNMIVYRYNELARQDSRRES